MNKYNEIIENKKYIEYLKELEVLEETREFCRHNISHFLDVARITYIKVLENNLSYSKDVIYAISLLHDIGRIMEYKENIPHNEASTIMAKDILSETSYTEKEIEEIIKAIENHRKESMDELSKLIYSSDKESRNCFLCRAESKCYWNKEKKNFKITY